jgi:hypothetical protein
MRPLTPTELLDVWERGQALLPVQRALALLATACPEVPADQLAGLPIGRRDGLLLGLREATFGPTLAALAGCPSCGERLEMSFRTADIRFPAEMVPPDGLTLCVAGHTVRFRLPDSRDLAAVAAVDPAAIPTLLLERCLLSAQCGTELCGADQLPPAVQEAIAERMARADPQADVRLTMACPACGKECSLAFDITSYFWTELDAWARRLLGEVHLLASAYGWRETDILALGPFRRQLYLEMVNG